MLRLGLGLGLSPRGETGIPAVTIEISYDGGDTYAPVSITNFAGSTSGTATEPDTVKIRLSVASGSIQLVGFVYGGTNIEDLASSGSNPITPGNPHIITGTPVATDADDLTLTFVGGIEYVVTITLTYAEASFTAYKLTAGDVTVTDTNMVNVKAFPAEANSIYDVVVIGRYTAAANDTGVKLGFTVPASATWTFGERGSSTATSGGSAGDGYGRGSSTTAMTASVAGGGQFGSGVGGSIAVIGQVTTGATAGDVTFQVGSEDTNDITVKSGLVVLMRKRSSRNLKIVSGSDATQSSNVTYTTLFTWAVSANRDYWFDVVLDYAAAASTTGIRPAWDLPAGATIIASYITRLAAGARGLVVRDGNDAAFADNQGATKAPLIARVLVRVSSTAGDVVLKFRSEVNTSTVTVYQGSFGSRTDVTGRVTVLAGDSSETTTTPENAFALAIDASKNYYFHFGGAFTTTTTVFSHLVDAPASAAFIALFTGQAPLDNAIAGNAARISNAASVPDGSSGISTEAPIMGDVWVENSTNAGNMVYAHASDGSGTTVVEIGSFAMVEEVTLAA